MKYEGLAKEIVALIGGKENVIGLTNCITRLRFKLKDESKADTEALKSLDGVVTVMQAGGQYQVVIGNHVPQVREAVDAQIGVLADTEDNGPKGNLFNQFVDMISGIFQPILAPLSAAGMLKGVAALLSYFLGAGFAGTPTYAVLNAMGDGLFFFLPIFIGYTAMKKFKGSPFIGMVIAAALVYPGFADGSIAGQFAETGGLNFFGIPFSVPMAGYASGVMPIIAATAFAAFLEKQFKKIIPDVVKLFLVPFFVMLISVPLTFLIIGPVMNIAADGLGSALMSLQTFSPILFGLILGGFWQILVMFGLHWAVIPFAIMALASGETTMILSAIGSVSFAQTGAIAAVMMKTKDAKLKQLAIPSVISGIFGVTEPGIYGITLPKKKPFWASCIVGGLAGAASMAAGVTAYQMGGLGIFAFTSNISPDGNISGAIWFFVISAAALVAGFALTWILGFEDGNVEKAMTKEEAKAAATGRQVETVAAPAMAISTNTNENEIVLTSPINGVTKLLSEASDAVFSQGLMGKGVVIEPTIGEVYAPFDGTVEAIFPTKHAIGLKGENGVELLIHVGMDTVSLEGRGFESFVNTGDTVKAGQLLLKFDIEAIKAAGLKTETPLIITNTDKFNEFKEILGDAIVGQKVLAVK